jgi:hypothetical protein
MRTKPKAIALATLLIGTAAPAHGQAEELAAYSEALVLLLARGMDKITTSYSGTITFKSLDGNDGDGYSVEVGVDRGIAVCGGTFRSGGQTWSIQGRGTFDLELEINDRHEYQFTVNCPSPAGHNTGLQELIHSYETPGGKVDLNPATCDPRTGKPLPGRGPCTLIWPEVLKGRRYEAGVASVTWALCQHPVIWVNPNTGKDERTGCP